MTRQRTTGFDEKQLKLKNIEIWIFDVGGARSERKKWIHAFEHVSAIVFVVDIAAWDQVLREDEDSNRTQEDLALFDSIVNSRWFINARFILLFTKTDKLEKKVKKGSISRYFPDFVGDETCVDHVKEHMERRFLALNSETPGKNIEVMFTSFSEGYNDPGWMVLDVLARFFS